MPILKFAARRVVRQRPCSSTSLEQFSRAGPHRTLGARSRQWPRRNDASRAAKLQYRLARAAYFPQFSLAAAFGYNRTQSSNWLTAAEPPVRRRSSHRSAHGIPMQAGTRAQLGRGAGGFDGTGRDYRIRTHRISRSRRRSGGICVSCNRRASSEAAAVTRRASIAAGATFTDIKRGLVRTWKLATNENHPPAGTAVECEIQMRRMSAKSCWSGTGRRLETRATGWVGRRFADPVLVAGLEMG